MCVCFFISASFCFHSLLHSPFYFPLRRESIQVNCQENEIIFRIALTYIYTQFNDTHSHTHTNHTWICLKSKETKTKCRRRRLSRCRFLFLSLSLPLLLWCIETTTTTTIKNNITKQKYKSKCFFLPLSYYNNKKKIQMIFSSICLHLWLKSFLCFALFLSR